jgi:uncharacterized protein YndB with AHSA1/START domain
MIKVERTIDAPPEVVWARMVELERWPTWTASITSLTRKDPGDLMVGSRARIKQPGFPPMTWTVTAVESGRSFTWEAGAPGATTVASHVLTANGTGTDLALTIEQRGPLGRLVGVLTAGRTRRFMQLEADGLAGASTAP